MARSRRIAVVVMSDEHSGLALSAAGHPWIQTPHLDAFAGCNTRFASAYTNSPICIPARAAFTTGRYTHQTRHWDNALPYKGSPAGWTHLLRDAGYQTAMIGKSYQPKELEQLNTEPEPETAMIGKLKNTDLDAFDVFLALEDGSGNPFVVFVECKSRGEMEKPQKGPPPDVTNGLKH